MSEEESTEELTFDEIGEDAVDPETTPTEESKDDSPEESPPAKEEIKDESEGEVKTDESDPEEKGGEEEKGKEDEVKVEEEEAGEHRQVALKDGDKFVNVDEEATVRVRVNGKNELVPVRDLMDNYSGKVGYEEQFATLQQEKAEYQEKETNLTKELETIGQLMSGDNPLDAALYLAELAGVKAVDFRHKIMNNLSDEVSGLLDMSETERELYLIKQDQEIAERLSGVAARASQSQETGGGNVEQLIRVADISKEDYEKSLNFLKEEGLGSKPEEVIRYTKLEPYIDQAVEVLRPFEESLGSDDLDKMTGLLAENLQKSGGQDAEKILSKVADHMGYEIGESSKERETKVRKESLNKETSTPENPQGSDLTFDDL